MLHARAVAAMVVFLVFAAAAAVLLVGAFVDYRRDATKERFVQGDKDDGDATAQTQVIRPPWKPAPEAGAAGVKSVEVVRSPDHKLEVVDTDDPDVGRCLLVDGRVQLCDKDEHTYHEMLVHFPSQYVAGGGPTSVAIFGGGDCHALREVLKYPTVERAVVFEWDQHLMALSEKHFDGADAMRGDKRVTWIFGDPVKQAARHVDANLQRYELIVVDTKLRPGASPFGLAFYKDARLMLKQTGVLVRNGDDHKAHLKTLFSHCMTYSFFTAALNKQYSMLLCADFDLRAESVDGANLRRHRVHTRFYDPAKHFSHVAWHAALKLPRKTDGEDGA